MSFSSRPARVSLPLRLGLVLALTSACLCSVAQAQWKWRDAQGRVQYSDRAPPASVPDREVLQRPGGLSGPPAILPLAAPTASPPAATAAASGPAATAASDAASRRRSPPDAEETRRLADEAQQRQRNEAAQHKARAENCQLARDQIKLIQDGVRLARINAQGEREILDDAGRGRELERARALQASDCR
ncbi:MAG: hypothetical protein RIQ60_3688 [Pseudomonadota bacterium]|jgi:hypothetical protein